MISRRGLLRALLGGAAALAVAPLAKAAEKIEYTFPNRPVVSRYPQPGRTMVFKRYKFRVPDMRGRGVGVVRGPLPPGMVEMQHMLNTETAEIRYCPKEIDPGSVWIPCDGRALDPREYQALFNHVQFSYGRV